MKASPKSSIHDFKAFAQKIWPRNTDIAHFLKKYHLGLSCDYLLSAKQTYRVAGLSCLEAGVCLSAILRGFPDVFSLFGPCKVGEISFRYSWTTGMK